MPKSAMKSKAMKAAKAMTKAQLADQLATKSELKKKDCGALRGPVMLCRVLFQVALRTLQFMPMSSNFYRI